MLAYECKKCGRKITEDRPGAWITVKDEGRPLCEDCKTEVMVPVLIGMNDLVEKRFK